MNIGNKIVSLRKKNNLSQEKLAEKVGVTRQTISKWELEETTPDISQAKILSEIFNVSLDELTNNNINNILVEKVSNTEKLAGIIIKILKVIGILLIAYVLMIIFMFVLFAATGKKQNTNHIESMELSCSLSNDNYLIEIGTDGYFNCSNCSKKLQKELKDNYIDYADLYETEKSIRNYFENNNGTCA